jgi:hypothetical protein
MAPAPELIDIWMIGAEDKGLFHFVKIDSKQAFDAASVLLQSKPVYS